MKKLLSILVLVSLCILALTSCMRDGSITVKENGSYVTITLDQFAGEKRIKIPNNVGEGTLFYKSSITEGNVTVSHTDGWFWPEYEMFTADEKNNTTGSMYLVGGDEEIIIITAEEAASGEIVLICARSSSPFE